MSAGSIDQNPYASPQAPSAPEPSVIEQMSALRAEFEGRYGQLVSDVVMAAEFSAAFGMLAWRLSENPAATAVVAAAPAVAITFEAVRDLLQKVARFPQQMGELRSRSSREWLSGVEEIDQ